jgi:NhaA family Na+:H+ antiporter
LGEAVSTALPWAIALGLVVGKIVGISAAVWLAVRTGLGRLPQGVGALHVPAVAAVAGIGFTVSLFIADLAYNDPSLTEVAKVGIFAGSLLAGVIGAALMIVAGRRPGVDATRIDASVPQR